MPKQLHNTCMSDVLCFVRWQNLAQLYNCCYIVMFHVSHALVGLVKLLLVDAKYSFMHVCVAFVCQKEGGCEFK